MPVPGRRTARDRVGTLPNFNENIEKGLTECPQARRDWVSLNRHMYTSDKRLRDFGGDPPKRQRIAIIYYECAGGASRRAGRPGAEVAEMRENVIMLRRSEVSLNAALTQMPRYSARIVSTPAGHCNFKF